MSLNLDGEERGRAIGAREGRMVGAGGPGAGRAISIIVFLILLGIAGLFLLVPDEIGRLLFGTSETQDIQETSQIDPGLSTELPRAPALEIPTPVQAPPAEIETPGDGAGAAEATRIAELERLIAELRREVAGQDGGVSAGQLEEILRRQSDENQAALEKALEDQRRALEALRPVRPASPVPTGPTPEDLAAAEARRRAEAERLRRAEERAAQNASDSLVLDESVPNRAGGGRSPVAGDIRELNNNEAFLAAAAVRGFETSRATQIANPGQTIVQGTIIEAVLETAINSDLPGLIRAVVTRDVYAMDGSRVILPSGTRLIGTYSSDISIAQRRALIAWNRAITEDGTSIELGSVGADRLGRSGQTGFVDTRFEERFGVAALISILGAVPAVAAGGTDTDTISGDTLEDIGDDLQRSSRTALDEYLRIPPTIFIDQGTQMTIFVNRDLVF